MQINLKQQLKTQNATLIEVQGALALITQSQQMPMHLGELSIDSGVQDVNIRRRCFSSETIFFADLTFT